MPLPTITGVARLTADPELKFTSSGKAVAAIRLAFNSRRLNQQTNQWEDGDTFFVRGQAWEHLAENVCETLQKGAEVLVTGELRTDRWERDGQKHEMPSLLIRSIGPSLAYAVAQVSRSPRDAAPQQGQRGPAQQRPQQARQAPQNDPWATSTPASTGGRGAYDEPPF